MIRLNDITEALMPVVGWEQDYNPNKQIDERLTESESGLYYQGAHPLLTLENVRAIMPDDFIYAYKEWLALWHYGIGAKVQHSGKVWKAIVANVGQEPQANSDYWEEYDMASDYIERETKSGIKKAVTRFVRDKVIGMETRNIIEKRTLFDGAGRIADTIQNKGRLVGFEITPLRQGGITMRIEKIGLQFKGNVGKIHLFLFHSSQPEPIWWDEFEITADNGIFYWFDIPNGGQYLPYLNPDTNAGGSWYLVYHQDSLPDYMEAVNFARDWSREPCSTCNKGDVMLYREMTKYVRISPFCVDVDSGSVSLWDISQNIYTNTLNYGMNLQFSIGCDLTDTIIEQRGIFADVIQKQVASDMLRTIALNPNVRVNRNQANVGRDNILYELDGNGMGVKGLNGDLEKAYKALSIDTKGLDKVCLGCHTGGVRIRAI